VTLPGATGGIVMVPMKNNVVPFPQPHPGATQVPSDDTTILYSEGGRRFAIQWIVTEVAAKRAEVTSMEKAGRRKNRPRSTQI
jgi:hypothetical protein